MGEMELFFHIAHAIMIIGTAVCCYCHFAKHTKTATVTLIAMGFISLALFTLRIFYYACGDIDYLESAALAFMDIFRYFTMGKSFSEIDPLPCKLYVGYYRMEILLSLLAAMCTATALYSLFQKLFHRVRLLFNSNGPVCYFSELNERSLTLAKTLNEPDSDKKGKQQKTKIVFCKVTEKNLLQAEAQALGAVTVDDPIHTISMPDPSTRQVRVFLIDDNEENNIQTLLKMNKPDTLYQEIPGSIIQSTVEASEAATNTTPAEDKNTSTNAPSIALPKSDFLVFSTQESAELVYNQVVNGLREKTLLYNLRLINETRQVSNKLLMEHPLYEAAEINKHDHISMLLVGCGYLGTQILKTAMLCGMMNSYKFDVQVVDDQADRLEQQFLHEHPFLANPSDIFPPRTASQNYGNPNPARPAQAPVFHQANVCTKAFDEVLENHCKDCNYIVVATGDDQLNVNTAEYLRRWYTQQVLRNPNVKNPRPLIFAAVRSPERHECLKALENVAGYCGEFHLFANNMDIYSARWVLDRPLDAAAAMFNYSYKEKLDLYTVRELLTWDGKKRRVSEQLLFQKTIIDQRSNQMAALHSLYKLQDLLHQDATDRNSNAPMLNRCPPDEIRDVFLQLVDLMVIEDNLTALADLEHRRWTMFHALSGWQKFEKEQIVDLHKNKATVPLMPDEIHKSSNARLHGCMIPTEELQDLSDSLFNATQTRKNFVKNDKVMCVVSLFAWLETAADSEAADILLCKLKTRNEKRTDQMQLLNWTHGLKRTPKTKDTAKSCQ